MEMRGLVLVLVMVMVMAPLPSCKAADHDFGTEGEYIMVRRSTLTVLVVFALLVVGVAIGVTRWLRRKAKETTATESPAAKLSSQSSQGGHRQVAAVAAHAHAHGSGTEASGRWSGLYRFTREEIERAVDYASSRIYLGSGSAGQVYQGVLPSGQLVAVKHIHRTAMSGSFTREVEQLCKVRHPNLVCLFGYCDEEGDQYLVYEYCANGNLAQNLLRSDSVLPWETRVKILRDCASVLRFLHTHPDGCIVHRDIKLTNILLTEKKVPKLSDFGLAKMLEMEETKVFTDVRGTIGYMDPEYITHSKLTCASDIYSFGVVTLQLLSGRKVIELDIVARDSLTKKAKDVVSGKKPLEEFIDPRVRDDVVIEDFVLILKIAVLCVASSSVGRPTIKDVFEEMDRALRSTAVKTRARKEMNAASLTAQYAKVLDV
ncbi:probable serine/threonine-protein kinase PBL28 [Zea mays]|uniref:Cysteine-rich receptor-like protein kinase 40 n=1 Tax=Zea mays TaxID=4577 RepID=A0A1D6EJ35_MAIZE|nr:probable serine/threonine-protein kinase PBL28 [Zea mays]ONM20108.1 Cysteine-rich receptor-like protein kinase 40 [Zea mays]|eukprot:XP_008669958.1 probable serine/threonine-protein kinase PBL28 [Zea mays]